MRYHVDTGLIIDEFNKQCECPLCAIEKIIEEQFLHEFLNDAVMEDSTREKVNKLGFCAKHFDMLFNRQNKLSVALQISTRIRELKNLLNNTKSNKSAKATAKKIQDSLSTCIICDLTKDSMKKYYKTIAQLFVNEKQFSSLLISSKGFCLKHYSKLLEYSSSAGFLQKQYLEILNSVEQKSFALLCDDLDRFCVKHDYRNANMPLGSAENALPNTRIKLYGEKQD